MATRSVLAVSRRLCASARASRALRLQEQLPRSLGPAWRRQILPGLAGVGRNYSSEPERGYRYLESHEWASLNGNTATVGISNYAQEKLGDLVFVELPEVGGALTKGEQFGVVESVKAAADLYSPLTGTVTEVNVDLDQEPELINQEPYQRGWIMKLEVQDPKEYEELLSPEDYQKFLDESI